MRYKENVVSDLSSHPSFQLPTAALALPALPVQYKMKIFSALFSTLVIAAVAQATAPPNQAVRKSTFLLN